MVERISRRLDGWKKSGAGEGKKDHLIGWDVVSKPKELGGLGFGKTSLRNIALLGKWLWRFPRERCGLWHKVIASIYETHPNGWDANMVVKWSHRCPWKAIAQVFQVSNPILFLPTKFLWSSKAPSKVKALAWHKLFNLAGLVWVPPRSFENMLVIAFKGLGNSLRSKTLWQIAYLTLIWLVWQERNNRIFEDKGRTEEMLWDLIWFYSSLWASCTEAFRGVPLSVLQLNWIAVYASKL
ncbi:hypothetical protein CK203_012544 [Vitis vinifera]|uniref:Uncharacterized protein n=1 Tax=Vitis vinifera TaxID=29760 RepID=A0A438KN26_VITVI|nr:hypothetical protein CK203_012544 [Vitis vinifera]